MLTAGQIRDYVNIVSSSTAEKDKAMLLNIGMDLLGISINRLDENYVTWLNELMDKFYSKYVLKGSNLDVTSVQLWIDARSEWMGLFTNLENERIGSKHFKKAMKLGLAVRSLAYTIQQLVLPILAIQGLPELLEKGL
ncbi:MAG: hypothetical protein R2824_31220 [Saprospiraceae bacterium]|nr:hypothetical protein [Lewinella sp.]